MRGDWSLVIRNLDPATGKTDLAQYFEALGFPVADVVIRRNTGPRGKRWDSFAFVKLEGENTPERVNNCKGAVRDHKLLGRIPRVRQYLNAPPLKLDRSAPAPRNFAERLAWARAQELEATR
jgi:hypothetical protein